MKSARLNNLSRTYMTRPYPKVVLKQCRKSTGADLVNLPRPNLKLLAGLHYDVETIDIVAGHVAGLLVIDKGVEGLALKGPHQ